MTDTRDASRCVMWWLSVEVSSRVQTSSFPHSFHVARAIGRVRALGGACADVVKVTTGDDGRVRCTTWTRPAACARLNVESVVRAGQTHECGLRATMDGGGSGASMRSS